MHPGSGIATRMVQRCRTLQMSLRLSGLPSVVLKLLCESSISVGPCMGSLIILHNRSRPARAWNCQQCKQFDICINFSAIALDCSYSFCHRLVHTLWICTWLGCDDESN